MSFDSVFLILSEHINREGRRLAVCIKGIVHESSDEVILQSFLSAFLGYIKVGKDKKWTK